MSKDLALFQRDWNLLLTEIEWKKYVERPCPVPKGLKLYLASGSKRVPNGRKTLPCSKGIETWSSLLNTLATAVERPCPVPKGLKQPLFLVYVFIIQSKDLALFQRDWNLGSDVLAICSNVERPCPVLKGLRLILITVPVDPFHVERPRPVPKGLKQRELIWLNREDIVERHCPALKGLRP